MVADSCYNGEIRLLDLGIPLLDLGISLDLELNVRETTFHWTSNSDLGNLSRTDPDAMGQFCMLHAVT